ncbi:MAG: hypothetical protein ACLFVR_08470 [Thiohalospira sp.]
MEPIPYFYDSIDRNAIVVRPKQPFFDWLNKIFQDEDPIVISEENNIYLVKEMDSNGLVLEWVKRNYDHIFVNELNDWYTDEKAWPQNRTYKMFSEWFEFEICSMILDLEDYPVTKE